MRRDLIRAPLVVGLLTAALGACVPAGAAESEQGRLRILANGRPIGSEHYQISATATELQARAEVLLEAGDEKVRQTASLLLNADGSPRHYEWKLEEPWKNWLRVEFEGSRATIFFLREDGKQEQQLFDFAGERVAVLDVNFFHHFQLLARLYDFARGGPQAIPVFIPQTVQPGVVTVQLEAVETQTVEGKAQPVRRLSITSEDNRVLLWLTESGRFVRLQVPQANVEVLAEGATP
ncbi:MAG TPA: hypothetical protein VJ085_02190 [Candidatus Acidoferrales bacterium]|nr:hypothetical protein [Candidatus Acidoferrales bacterium]